jgi:uncharacterized membrane protein
MANRWETGRLEAFSDGVMAIAITLLVLELSVPEAAFEHLWRGIADQWPSYLAYLTSFTTIGAIWLVHHGMFRRLAAADGVITRLNLLLLMLASFLPFPTKLVAKAVDSGHGERPAVMFYGLVLLSISTVITVMWRHIAAHRDLLNAEVSDSEVDAITRQTAPNIGFYAVIVLFAIVAPTIAAFGYLAIAVLVVFRSRGDYSAATPQPAR